MSNTTQIRVLPSKKQTSVCIRTETSPLYTSLYLFPEEALRVGVEIIQNALRIIMNISETVSSLDLIEVSTMLNTLALQAKQTVNRTEEKKGKLGKIRKQK